MPPERYSCEIAFPKSALEHFVEHGWSMFPYTGTPLTVRTMELLTLYEEFLKQPTERLRRFTVYVNREGNNEPDDGYIRKGGEQRNVDDEYSIADRKTYFHYRPDFSMLLSQDVYTSLTPLERRFLEKCHDAYLFGLLAKFMLARELDRILPGFHFYDTVSSRRAMSLHVLRILSYDPPKADGAEVGKRHFDRDWVTSQLFQSEEGLHLIDPVSGRDITCGTSDSHVVFFCGDKMPLMTGGIIDDAVYKETGKRMIHGGRIPRVEHYIAGNTTMARRKSIIFFAQSPHGLPWGK